MTNNVIKTKLESLGYTYNAEAQAIISECNDWYKGKVTEFHKKTNINNQTVIIKTMNFAKRGCADDANMCEVVEINTGDNKAQFEGLNEVLTANNFEVMYRQQLERLSATGTVGCYVRIDNATYYNDGSVAGGDLRLNYCYAENIVPITVENNEIIECAFAGEDIRRGKKIQTLVIFLKNNGKYSCDTYIFEDDKETDNANIQLGEVKPFAIMRCAQVNNLDNMAGYGFPKLYASIPVLQILDLSFNILYGDVAKGEKLIFINELLSCIKKDDQNRPFLSPQQKELFILLGEKLPEQGSVIQEYNPQLRIDAITKIFETTLSFLSMAFGYGSKKYTFENGYVKTASEYIGEKQDSMQELNRQRKEADQYITTICRAIMWFSNQFKGTSWNVAEEISIEYDDSYIEDKAVKLERTRNDALQFGFPQLVKWYLMDAYNMTEDEAQKMLDEAQAQAEAQQMEDDLGEEE